jgi:hypothetical protein
MGLLIFDYQVIGDYQVLLTLNQLVRDSNTTAQHLIQYMVYISNTGTPG